VVVIAISPSASRRRVAASWLRAVSGIPSGSLPPLAARSAAPLMYLAAAQQRRREQDLCRVAGLLQRGVGGMNRCSQARAVRDVTGRQRDGICQGARVAGSSSPREVTPSLG
jgi:hypothetical protein